MTVSIDRLVRSRRKTIALIVEGDGSLTVRAPLDMPEEAIRAFVEQHADLVRKYQQQVQEKAQASLRQYQAGDTFLFLGKSYPLRLVSNQCAGLTLTTREFRLLRSALPQARQVFEGWYRSMAALIISTRLMVLAEKHGFRYKGVRISSARTRWGSCSPKGTLSFSWRLVMALLEVIDYVIVRELVHLKIPTHSPEFWAKVEKILPDYRKRRAWLKKNGKKLTL